MRDLRRHFENAKAHCEPNKDCQELLGHITTILTDIIAAMKTGGFDASLDYENSKIIYYEKRVSLETRLNITDTAGKLFADDSNKNYAEFSVRAEKLTRSTGPKIFGGQAFDVIDIAIPYYEPKYEGWVNLDMTSEGAAERAAEVLIGRYARRCAGTEVKREMKEKIESGVAARTRSQKPGW